MITRSKKEYQTSSTDISSTDILSTNISSTDISSTDISSTDISSTNILINKQKNHYFCTNDCVWKNIDINYLYSIIDLELEKDPYWIPHKNRYQTSVNYILEHLHDLYHLKGHSLNIMNLGGAYSTISETISKIQGVNVIYYEDQFDVRYEWPNNINFKNVDLFIATEVVEHLRDIETSPRCTFTSSGILGMLSECYKNMNDDALLFITTPNCCSFIQIYNLLVNKSPFMYNLHVREMSFDELKGYINQSKMYVTHYTTINNFEFDEIKLNFVLDLLKNYNFSTDNRFDNIFLLCKKNNNY
jgi:hypothetical protein